MPEPGTDHCEVPGLSRPLPAILKVTWRAIMAEYGLAVNPWALLQRDLGGGVGLTLPRRASCAGEWSLCVTTMAWAGPQCGPFGCVSRLKNPMGVTPTLWTLRLESPKRRCDPGSHTRISTMAQRCLNIRFASKNRG